MLKHTPTHRTCYKCKQVKSVALFTRRSNGYYFSACKECNKIFKHNRRVREKNAEKSYTLEEWNNKIKDIDCCPCCKRKWIDIPLLKNKKSIITIDHIIPLSKGRNNSIDNLQPLCQSCNSAKGCKIISYV